MSNSIESAFRIDVISDVVCPWCFIGKRRLEDALARLAAREPALVPSVRWHPFQLNPDLPREGIDRRSYLEAKFGGPQRAQAIYDRIRSAGETVGIAFAFERITRQPNTLDAHRLIAWAQADGRDASMLVEGLFAAYFLEGRAIGDVTVLGAIAAEAGLDAAAARAHLESADDVPFMHEADRRARAMGITGVPFFILADKVTVSGAQSAEVLLEAIGQARSNEGVTA